MAIVRVFRVGQLVRWTSASRGVWRHHVGVVVVAVPAGELPVPPAGPWLRRWRDGGTRPHASYLVALKGQGRGAGLLCWPRVRHLELYGEGAILEAVKRNPGIIRDALLASGVWAADVPPARALVPYVPPARPGAALVVARAACALAAAALLLGIFLLF